MTDIADCPTITLLPQRIEFCMRLGAEIYERRRFSEHDNNLPREEVRDLRRTQEAAMSEAAMMLYLTKFLPLVHWEIGPLPGLPDLNGFIEVKRINKVRHRLLMRFKEDPSRAFVSVIGLWHPKYVLRGWRWGYDVKQFGVIDEPNPGRPCYALDLDDLWPVHSLVEEARRRPLAPPPPPPPTLPFVTPR